ncbi:MAG: glycine oxidase ThiO [Acidobacteriaceae bacterium]
MRARTIIIGGGIIGLLAARELLVGGEPVTLLEAEHLGYGASWAGGGILSPLEPWTCDDEVTRLSLFSQRLYPGLVKTLASDTGIDAQWCATGMLSLNEDSARALAWAGSWRQDVRVVAGDALHAIEPAIGPVEHALWMPEVAQVRNPRLIKALRSDVTRRGGRIEEGVRVTGFRIHAGQLEALRTDQGERPVDRCVIAAGAWSAELLASIGIRLPIGPVKGQMLMIRGQPQDVRHMIQDGPCYLVPRLDGRILVGSTLEPDAGFDLAVTPAAKTTLHRAAIRMVPALAARSVEAQWAGIRPGSPNGIPFIGSHPAANGLFVCTGHFRNGILLAAASARLIADVMLGRRPALEVAPYSPGRDLTEKPL